MSGADLDGPVSEPGDAAGPACGWVTVYDASSCDHRVFDEVRDLAHCPAPRGVTWVHTEGSERRDLYEEVGQLFGIHDLAIEDVVHTRALPKVEDYENGYFIIARILGREDGEIGGTQASLYLGRNFLVTHVQKPHPLFSQVVEMVRGDVGRIRKLGPDFLAYLILDKIIDGYFPVLDEFDVELDELEDRLSARVSERILKRVHHIQRDLVVVRRLAWPMKEVVYALMRDEKGILVKDTRLHLRDCHDHTTQIIDRSEHSRETAAGLMQYFHFAEDRQRNEIMKMLTIISTIFLPLTFIAGVYGMNFDRDHAWNMPELGWPFGYLFSLGLMALTAAVMLLYFVHKDWIGASEAPRWLQWLRRWRDRAARDDD